MVKNTKKKLAAIMFSKFVEFEKYLAEDESFAVKILSDNDKYLDEQINNHSGRVIKHIDETVFVEFASSTDAVNCAIAIHNALLKHNSQNSESYQINSKIGIHMGEVYEKDGDLFGDGVNLASRIQPIAKTAGTVTSQAVYNTIRSDKNIFVRDMGRVSLKNIKEPERVFKIYLDETEFNKETDEQLKEKLISKGVNLVDRLSSKKEIKSIAVLYIKNLGSNEDDFFCYGLTEDLILDINNASRMKIPMIADVMKYKDQQENLNEITSTLGVQFIVIGNIMKMESKFKVSLQLYSKSTSSYIWSHGWEDNIKNIKSIKAEIASKILTEIGSDVPESILNNLKDKNEIAPEAYELFLKGKYSVLNATSTVDREIAQDLFKKAIKIESNYLEARYHYAMTMVHNNQFERAVDILDDAMIIARNNRDNPGIAGINTIYGNINYKWGKFEKAVNYFEKALEQRTLNNNIQEEAKILNNVSLCYTQLGQMERALEFANRSLELKREISDKRGIAASLFSTSLIYRRISDYAKAIKYSQESIELFDELNITMHDTILKMNLGLFLVFVGKFEDAKLNFIKAISISKKMNDFGALGMCHRGLGLIHLDQGNWKFAQKEFKQANKFHQKAEHRTAFEATTVFLGMSYFFDEQYEKAKEFIDKALIITQRRREVSFYDTSAKASKILLSSKLGECTASDIDEFSKIVIESGKVKQINRELYYISQAYLNIKNQEMADKYQSMCREGLLKDAEKISDQKLKEGYLNKSLHKNMLSKEAVLFKMDTSNQHNPTEKKEGKYQEIKKTKVNLDKNNNFYNHCYEITNNSNYNFCPNCGQNNTNYDFKFCPDCGTLLSR